MSLSRKVSKMLVEFKKRESERKVSVKIVLLLNKNVKALLERERDALEGGETIKIKMAKISSFLSYSSSSTSYHDPHL